jgi:hypothetical protein
MVPIFDPDRHWSFRVNDLVTWHGMHAIILQNELLQIVNLIDTGAEIIQFMYKPLDIDFFWHNANYLRDPHSFDPSGGSDATSFLNFNPMIQLLDRR